MPLALRNRSPQPPLLTWRQGSVSIRRLRVWCPLLRDEKAYNQTIPTSDYTVQCRMGVWARLVSVLTSG